MPAFSYLFFLQQSFTQFSQRMAGGKNYINFSEFFIFLLCTCMLIELQSSCIVGCKDFRVLRTYILH